MAWQQSNNIKSVCPWHSAAGKNYRLISAGGCVLSVTHTRVNTNTDKPTYYTPHHRLNAQNIHVFSALQSVQTRQLIDVPEVNNLDS